MARFVVLHHSPGAGLQRSETPHLDWLFEVEGTLRAFATDIFDPLQATEKEATRLADHRIMYLDFEGEISGGRGHVVQRLAGTYESHVDNSESFTARITWEHDREQVRADVAFYRNLPDDLRFNETRDGWRLRCDPCR